MKKEYTVLRREVLVQPITIEAESEEQAIELVSKGGGEVVDVKSYFMDQDNRTVELEYVVVVVKQ